MTIGDNRLANAGGSGSIQAPAAGAAVAPGVTQHDVEPVFRPTKGSAGPTFYAARKKVYPKLAHGYYRNVKWAVMAVTLGIYYLLPWIRWNRGPGLPDQAFLLDFAHQRLYFGPIEIWAQEFYYITGLLVISALGLFLVTSIAGRMWCGYACPQTVWTDLMVAVERFWLGDRNEQMRRDKNKWAFDTLWRKAATHATWLLIGLMTGGALVFYFVDAPTLFHQLVTGTAPGVAYFFMALFAFTTYLLGGIAREQVCIYMCPWPRIQGAMLDHDSLLVSYRTGRGEPRGAHKKNQSWDGRGDCVDCKACVAVCPTGIDIRNGPQLECIQCALCIDACNEIMDKVGRPRDLIAYTTVGNVENAACAPRDGWRVLRPRTILYGVVISLISGGMLWSLMNRGDLDMSVQPDRNPLFVTLSDGGIRNGYTLKIVNKQDKPRSFVIDVSGLDSARVSMVGVESKDPIINVIAADVRAVKIYLTVPAGEKRSLKTDNMPVIFKVSDIETGITVSRATTFRSPAQ